MPAKTARLFNNGGSQAVRLPAEFRFEGDVVFLRRDTFTGDVILSNKTAWSSWDEYFEERDSVKRVPKRSLEAFMKDRPLNVAFPERSLLEKER